MDQKTISSVDKRPFRKHEVEVTYTATRNGDKRAQDLPGCSTSKQVGECYCGNIKYLVSGDPVIQLYCFCEDCHSITGSDGYYSGYLVKDSDFRLIQGTPAIHEELSEEGRKIFRYFCGKCGSDLWAQTDPGLLSVSAGTFNDPDVFCSAKKVFVHDAPDWARQQNRASNQSPYDGNDNDTEFISLEQVAKPESQSFDAFTDEDDTNLEFENIDPEPGSGSRSHVFRDDEDDTNLEFESVDMEPGSSPRSHVFRDDEDDTNLEFEGVGKDDRRCPDALGYRPRNPPCR